MLDGHLYIRMQISVVWNTIQQKLFYIHIGKTISKLIRFFSGWQDEIAWASQSLNAWEYLEVFRLFSAICYFCLCINIEFLSL